MARRFLRNLILWGTSGLFSACANIVPPSGGPKDITAPQLRSVTPQDSLLNTRVKRIEMKFDEFITVSDVSKELHISPALDIAPTMTGSGKTVIVKIPDTLLQDQTTYTISFGSAIKDLHEGNPYLGKTYLFSTGAWFDSLQLKGHIKDAQSGNTDSSAKTRVLLYPGSLPFDAVSMQKPAYVTTADASGNFRFSGLPGKSFRIFALKESNDNLQLDKNEEYVGFLDTTVNPAIDTGSLLLTIFQEEPDSTSTDAPATNGKRRSIGFGEAAQAPIPDSKNFSYAVRIDTADRNRRTVEINTPLAIAFSRKLSAFNEQRITLQADSTGTGLDQAFHLEFADTTGQQLRLHTGWKPNTLYTLRLLKGFATDTTGADALPSKYIFRTKQEEDYGKIDIHIPGRYSQSGYLLQVKKDADSIYLKSITDTSVSLRLLSPGNYRISIIEDSNRDGLWTTGDLKKRRHPEKVIPHPVLIMLKPGWEHVVDIVTE